MKPIPFNPETDMAPIPFDEDHLQLARELKQSGMPWIPHAGCFVWDPEELLAAESPFPHRVYFILSLPPFLGLLGSLEAVKDKLVWVPTWHQARLVAYRIGLDPKKIAALWSSEAILSPGEELMGLYRLILEKLKKNT